MPKPPVETIKSFARSKVMQMKETLKSKPKFLDFLMALVIFLTTLIEYISWRLQNTSTPAKITNICDGYLVYTYPLLMQLTITFFASFFFMKIIRYKSCVWSTIISTVYFLIQIINLYSIIFKIGMPTYETIIYPILLLSIFLLTFLKTLRWFSK